MDTETFQVVVGQEYTGCRLDNFLQQSWPRYSRTRLQGWIHRGRVLINGDQARPSALLRSGQVITVQPEPLSPLRAEAENIPLDVLYEDQDLVAINKPS